MRKGYKIKVARQNKEHLDSCYAGPTQPVTDFIKHLVLRGMNVKLDIQTLSGSATHYFSHNNNFKNVETHLEQLRRQYEILPQTEIFVDNKDAALTGIYEDEAL